jgi:diguanylate cyclase (GGDEF)-like protein
MGVHIVQWSIIGCLTKLPDIQYSREGFIVILIALSFIGYTTSPKIFIPGLSLYFVNCVSAYIIVKNTTNKIAPLGQYITIGFPLALGFILALMRLHKNWLEKESLYEKTEDLAFKDALTGAYNRNYMQNNLIDATDHFKFSGSIAIVDIDDFKKINDTFGHLEGDNKLKQLVNAITFNIRSATDCVVRYGGEEFLIFFKNCSEKDAYNICNKILDMIHKLGFSFSGGLCYINKELLVKDNLKLIDSYLYYAKNNGKNQIISSGHMKDIFTNRK